MSEPHHDTLFGELRSILHQSPSTRRWERLCHAIDQWESLATTSHEDVLHYVDTSLHRWPAQYRRPPARWLDRQIDAVTTHTVFWPWSLVRVLEVHDTTPLSSAHLTHTLLSSITQLTLCGARAHLFLHRLTQVPRLPITHLTIERWPLSSRRQIDALRALALPHLDVLRLTRARQTHHSVAALCQLPLMERLRFLDLSHNFIDDRAIDTLLEAPPPRLEHLDLTGNKLSVHGARRLLDHPFTRQLYTLSLGNNLDLSPALTTKLLDGG